MTEEGKFPKSDGDILYASEINTLNDKSFETEAQNRYSIIYNSDVAEFNTLQTDNWVAGFETLSSSDNYDTGNSTCQYNSYVGCFAASLLDTFDDESIDATIWTENNDGGSISEHAEGYLILQSSNTSGNSAQIYTKGSGPGFDGKVADSSFMCSIHASYFDYGHHYLKITNGTNYVTIYEISAYDAFIELWFDTSEDTVRYRIKSIYKNISSWSAWSDTIDISSVTNNWYVTFHVEATESLNINLKIYDTWYVQGAVTQTFQTNSYDHTQTSTDPNGAITLDHGIFTANKNLNGATTTWSISSDNGGNWSTLNENEISTISNASNQLVLKTSITSSADRPSYIYEFGVKAWDLV